MKSIGLTLSSALVLTACGNTFDSAPLIFGQGISVGITAGPATTNNASGEIVVGVKQADIAIVPTVVPEDLQGPYAGHGNQANIRSHGATGSENEKGREDALSTFGSFSTDTQLGSVKLGIFFATGVAAQAIAEGFACGVSNNGGENCQPEANTPQPENDSGGGATQTDQ